MTDTPKTTPAEEAARLRRPGRDDIADAIEAGIEAASEAVSNMPAGQKRWDTKEYRIAETAARAAVEDLWERMHD